MRSVTPATPLPIDYAAPSRVASPRLLSLDVFRGLVILAMLLVNNLGDGPSTGYFWKHADWAPVDVFGSQPVSFGRAWVEWWQDVTSSPAAQKRLDLILDKSPQWGVLTQYEKAARPWSYIPLLTFCTLADYVMPCFMLIIGLAIPFSVASMRARGTGEVKTWLRVLKRAGILVLLGWILCYFRDQFARSLYGEVPWTFTFGMDVLQLLGVGYLVARTFYEFAPKPRAAIAAILLIWHWAILRFYPQGIVASGTFTEANEAIGYIYSHWHIWDIITLNLGRLTIGWRGLMSVPPAAATMLIGTLMGDLLRRGDFDPQKKVRTLATWSAILIVIGFLWAFDLPFNKPRWTPCYLVYVSGVGGMLIAILYNIIDIHQIRGWTYPLVVFGTNALALYFISIMAKVLLLNTPRISDEHRFVFLLMKYSTFTFATIVIALCTARAVLIARRAFGAAAYAIIAIVLLMLAVMWTRAVTQPTILIGMDDLTVHILDIVKCALGPWAGGWLFTVVFIAFWWLVLEQMYRRKIFWKL